MPPSRASAIASRASVTVSIAAETIGNAQLDRPRQPRSRRDVVRQHPRLGGDEQHVVEREPFLRELPVERDEPLELVGADLDAHATPPLKHKTQAPPGRLGWETLVAAVTLKYGDGTSLDGREQPRRTHGPNTCGLVSSRCGRCSRRWLSRPPVCIRRRPPPRPQTLYQLPPHQQIAAFAQDGAYVAWLAPSSKGCNVVHVLSLANGGQIRLPDESANARNVTCRWEVVPPVRLALAEQADNVLWTLREPAPVPFDYVLGAGFTDPQERRFGEIAHGKNGTGLWLGGVAGDGRTLVYAVSSVAYVDQVACLAGGSCRRKLIGGGIHKIVGRDDVLVPGTWATVAVAAFGNRIADVQAADVAERRHAGRVGEPSRRDPRRRNREGADARRAARRARRGRALGRRPRHARALGARSADRLVQPGQRHARSARFPCRRTRAPSCRRAAG